MVNISDGTANNGASSWLHKNIYDPPSTCKIERHFSTRQQTWFGLKLIFRFGFPTYVLVFWWYRSLPQLNGEMPWNPADSTNPPTLDLLAIIGVSCEPSHLSSTYMANTNSARPPTITKNFPRKHSQLISSHYNLNYCIHKIIHWIINKHLKK